MLTGEKKKEVMNDTAGHYIGFVVWGQEGAFVAFGHNTVNVLTIMYIQA